MYDTISTHVLLVLEVCTEGYYNLLNDGDDDMMLQID